MKAMKNAILVLLAILLALPARAEKALFQLELPLVVGAQALVHGPQGTLPLGTVREIPGTSKYPGYTASAWAQPGTVAATAVNAIHLSIAVEKDRGRIMSLLPAETVAPAAGAGSALVVDCPAGRGLFGAWSPSVGSPVTVRSADGQERSLAQGLPQPGETLWIAVTEKQGPYMVDMENRAGGDVTAYFYPRQRRVIARVAHPLGGSGRFEGSLFQRGSALRANHCGVICVSTCPEGEVGGFQIIPIQHSYSREMAHSWNMTQWMILEPLEETEAMVGQPPLFSDYLVPGPAEGEQLWDLWSTYGRRSLILCRVDGGPWQKLPSVVGRDDNAFSSITHLRIYYPTTREPFTPRD